MKNQKHRDLDKDPKASDIKPTKSTKTKPFGNYPRCQGLHALFVSDCASLSQIVPGTTVKDSIFSSPFLQCTIVEQFLICRFSSKKVFPTTAFPKRKQLEEAGIEPQPPCVGSECFIHNAITSRILPKYPQGEIPPKFDLRLK